MRFLFPWGLLGLIAVPILIIIYILRNRYKEHVISSSYLFELSERFLKRKKILKKFEGILSLILEIVFVIFLSLSLAHPIFYQEDRAENICFILDASGSMNIKKDDMTRFDVAKNKMNEIVSSSHLGSTYTLIYAGLETKTILKRSDSKDVFYQMSASLNAEGSYVELDDALTFADEYYQKGEISSLYVITDKNYKSVHNVEWINVSNHEENYATYDLSVEEKEDQLEIQGKVLSYESDVTLKLNCYVNDKLVKSQEIKVNKDIESRYIFNLPYQKYDSIYVEIENVDALDLDNMDKFYPLNVDNSSRIALISNKPFFLKTIIKAIGLYDLEVFTPETYNENSNYDLYIFDEYTPSSLPINGSTWLMNTKENILNSGFLVQEERDATGEYSVQYTDEDSILYKEITKNTHRNNMLISQYMKYSLYQNFTIILNYDSYPLLFVGSNGLGKREVVFSFDLHNSDLPLLYDFIPLMINLLNYSLPMPIEDKNYVAGDNLQINLFDNVEKIKIISPLGENKYLPLVSDIVTYPLKEVGTYKVCITTDGEEKTYSIYVGFSKDEGYINVEKEDSFSLETNSAIEKNISINDYLIVILFVCAIFFILDWVVYSHEQY